MFADATSEALANFAKAKADWALLAQFSYSGPSIKSLTPVKAGTARDLLGLYYDKLLPSGLCPTLKAEICYPENRALVIDALAKYLRDNPDTRALEATKLLGMVTTALQKEARVGEGQGAPLRSLFVLSGLMGRAAGTKLVVYALLLWAKGGPQGKNAYPITRSQALKAVADIVGSGDWLTTAFAQDISDNAYEIQLTAEEQALVDSDDENESTADWERVRGQAAALVGSITQAKLNLITPPDVVPGARSSAALPEWWTQKGPAIALGAVAFAGLGLLAALRFRAR